MPETKDSVKVDKVALQRFIQEQVEKSKGSKAPAPKKISQTTPLSFKILLGCFFIAVGLALMFFLGQTRTVICYRAERNRIDCRIESDFLGIMLREVEIRQVQSAGVEVHKDGDTYRVVLVTKSGNFPLTSHYSSGRHSKQKAADRINAFIDNPNQPSLEVRETHGDFFIIGVIFFLVGLGVTVGDRISRPLPGWLLRFLNRRMFSLAEVLDNRHFELRGIFTCTMSGLYQGRPTRFYYSPGGGSDSMYGGSPAEFHVVLSCRPLFSFKIYKESMGTKVGKALGFVPDVEIGDPELDRQLVFRCDSPQSFTDWMGRPEVKEKVASLVLAEGVDSLQYDDGFLGVYYVRGGFYIGPIALRLRSSPKEEMTPWNVTFVLQKLETLAQSLESSSE